ncbi:unnamed protein product [Bemisia tabaci]|uniref:Uncharacterized protein n=1 Tax=Bemisia tabaci TaxID=7038 RepID=A0A9P0A0V8_BEMTA|nr:unnamed protein product [Bemisia tabaci]
MKFGIVYCCLLVGIFSTGENYASGVASKREAPGRPSGLGLRAREKLDKIKDVLKRLRLKDRKKETDEILDSAELLRLKKLKWGSTPKSHFLSLGEDAEPRNTFKDRYSDFLVHEHPKLKSETWWSGPRSESTRQGAFLAGTSSEESSFESTFRRDPGERSELKISVNNPAYRTFWEPLESDDTYFQPPGIQGADTITLHSPNQDALRVPEVQLLHPLSQPPSLETKHEAAGKRTGLDSLFDARSHQMKTPYREFWDHSEPIFDAPPCQPSSDTPIEIITLRPQMLDSKPETSSPYSIPHVEESSSLEPHSQPPQFEVNQKVEADGRMFSSSLIEDTMPNGLKTPAYHDFWDSSEASNENLPLSFNAHLSELSHLRSFQESSGQEVQRYPSTKDLFDDTDANHVVGTPSLQPPPGEPELTARTILGMDTTIYQHARQSLSDENILTHSEIPSHTKGKPCATIAMPIDKRPASSQDVPNEGQERVDDRVGEEGGPIQFFTKSGFKGHPWTGASDPKYHQLIANLGKAIGAGLDAPHYSKAEGLGTSRKGPEELEVLLPDGPARTTTTYNPTVQDTIDKILREIRLSGANIEPEFFIGEEGPPVTVRHYAPPVIIEEVQRPVIIDHHQTAIIEKHRAKTPAVVIDHYLPPEFVQVKTESVKVVRSEAGDEEKVVKN